MRGRLALLRQMGVWIVIIFWAPLGTAVVAVWLGNVIIGWKDDD